MVKTLLQETIQSKKDEASVFAPFWNEIINCLRAEDYVTNRYVVYR